MNSLIRLRRTFSNCSAIVCILLLIANPGVAQTVQLPFEVSKETTVITKPKLSSGYLDFATAINQHYSSEIDSDQNFARVIYQSIPWRADDQSVTRRFYHELGIDFQSEHAKTLTEILDSFRFIRQSKNREAAATEYLEAHSRPWTDEEFPKLANWLDKTSEQLRLDRLIRNSDQKHFFLPVVLDSETAHPGSLSEDPMLYGQFLPALENILRLRITRNIGERNPEETWDELLSYYRIGHLAQQGPFCHNVIWGHNMIRHADELTLMYLNHIEHEAKQLETVQRDLAKLGPVSDFSRHIDFENRMMFVDQVAGFSVGNNMRTIGSQTSMLSLNRADIKELIAKEFQNKYTTIDWGTILIDGHEWIDRIVKGLRQPTVIDRQDALQELDGELLKMVKALETPLNIVTGNHDDNLDQRTLDLAIKLSFTHGELWLASVMDKNRSRLLQNHVNLLTAFQLARYKNLHGEHPATLNELIPQFRSDLPTDLYVEKPLKYRKKESGYLLYSVGENRLDNDGLQHSSAKDDISIEISN